LQGNESLCIQEPHNSPSNPRSGLVV
jgi:hypothetical protein